VNLMPFIDLLENANLGTRGESLFINMMPPTAHSAVLLKNRLTGTKIDHELPGYYQTKFNVVVRGTGYTIGEPGELVDQVVAALTLSEGTLGTMKINYVRPLHLPVVFPLSNGNILEWNIEFAACFVQL
jgi:hypothetical protein